MARRQIEPVLLDSVLEEIENMVRAVGTPRRIAHWRAAFPDPAMYSFEDLDTQFTGQNVNWDRRTLREKAAFVAYMFAPQAARLEFEIRWCGKTHDVRITDSEKLWYCWFFRAMNDSTINTRACLAGKRTLLGYALREGDTPFEEEFVEHMLDTSAQIRHIRFFVAPLAKRRRRVA